jgi:hypothetical protein
MQGGGPFSQIPIWGFFIGTLLLVLVSVEAGYRWARYRQTRSQQEKEAPVGAMVGATLGLLAFLLAITFAMAADSFHARRVALLDEVNAIRTAYLRTDLIVEPQRTEVRKLLAEYVDERLHWVGVRGRAEPSHSPKELHDRLWAQAAAVDFNSSSEVVSLFVESLNKVIDLHAERILVRERSRIPGTVWVVLYLVAVLTLAAMGYHGGVAGTCRSPVMLAVALAFSLVIVLIVDLDRPGEGLIDVSQQMMIDLRDSLADTSPQRQLINKKQEITSDP